MSRLAPARARRLLGALTGLAVMSVTAGCGMFGSDTQTLTAYFDRAVGLYEKSDVRILGVRIGEVTDIEPEGDKVRVEMQYDAKYKLPADAGAVVVAPSIVSDRYVQITPAYESGPVLADGSTLDIDRTEVPLELDEVYANLDKLNLALGPQGANKDGALSDLLSVSAENLEGNGELLGSTLEDFSQAIETLSNQREDLFGTVRNLQDFTSTIANSDSTVRAFNRDLADVADQLAGEREDLARAVRQLSIALGDVAVFVRENRESLTTNITELAEFSKVLVSQRQALEEFLDTAPSALSNLQLAYNPSTGTLDTRDNGNAQSEQSPLRAFCTAITEAPGAIAQLPPELRDQGEALATRCDEVESGGGGGLTSLLDQLGSLPSGASSSTASAAAPPSALPVPGDRPAAVPVPRDTSLRGLLLGTR